MFFRGQTARAIESALTEGCCRVQRTMPADLPPTPGYLAMNSDPLGIPAEKAEQASWQVNEAHRFTVEPGFVLLATVPAPPDRPGGWSMLLLAHDARDGTGSLLLGAWWLGAQAPAKPAAAFGWFVGRFGVPLRDGGRRACSTSTRRARSRRSRPAAWMAWSCTRYRRPVSSSARSAGPGASASTRKSTGLTSARSPEPSPDRSPGAAAAATASTYPGRPAERHLLPARPGPRPTQPGDYPASSRPRSASMTPQGGQHAGQ